MNSSDYLQRSPDYYLSKLEPEILENLTPSQLQSLRQILHEAIPQPAPKLVDLRFVVDLIVSQFYVVLFIGKDRRKRQRRYLPESITQIGNVVAVTVILIVANFTISAFILLAVYLIKSMVGINLLPGHFPDLLKSLLGVS